MTEIAMDVRSLWTPPAGMRRQVAEAWRRFYARGLSGEAGYIITPRQYRLLYIAQKGRCWICQKAKGIHPDDPNGRGTRRLATDHNHVSGQVRGLLCSGSLSADTCNRMIDRYTPQALARAAKYKSDPPARVLAEMDRMASDAESAGYACPDDELAALGQAFLWHGSEQP